MVPQVLEFDVGDVIRVAPIFHDVDNQNPVIPTVIGTGEGSNHPIDGFVNGRSLRQSIAAPEDMDWMRQWPVGLVLEDDDAI
jgi:hypothetical protein